MNAAAGAGIFIPSTNYDESSTIIMNPDDLSKSISKTIFLKLVINLIRACLYNLFGLTTICRLLRDEVCYKKFTNKNICF